MPKSIDKLREERPNLGRKPKKPAKRKEGMSIDDLRKERGYDQKQRAAPAKHGTSIDDVRKERGEHQSKRRPPVEGRKNKKLREAAEAEVAVEEEKKAPPPSEE